MNRQYRIKVVVKKGGKNLYYPQTKNSFLGWYYINKGRGSVNYSHDKHLKTGFFKELDAEEFMEGYIGDKVKSITYKPYQPQQTKGE